MTSAATKGTVASRGATSTSRAFMIMTMAADGGEDEEGRQTGSWVDLVVDGALAVRRALHMHGSLPLIYPRKTRQKSPV